jgi:hypothetical protein
VVSFTPASEETGALGREIEYRRGIGWYFVQKNNIFLKIDARSAFTDSCSVDIYGYTKQDSTFYKRLKMMFLWKPSYPTSLAALHLHLDVVTCCL